MLLRHLGAAVAEQHRDSLHWHAGLKQANCEHVSKAVRMAVRDSRVLEYAL